jgi:hypothetical protein
MYKYIIRKKSLESSPTPLHSLPLSGFVRIILVGPFLGVGGVEERMDVGGHARATGWGAGGVDAFEGIPGSGERPAAVGAQCGRGSIACQRRRALTGRLLAGAAGQLVRLQSITELLVAASDRRPMRRRRPLCRVLAGCIGRVRGRLWLPTVGAYICRGMPPIEIIRRGRAVPQIATQRATRVLDGRRWRWGWLVARRGPG